MKKNIACMIMTVVFLPLALLAQTENWVYRYNTGGTLSEDAANAIVYGADGKIYAAGVAWGNVAVISLTTAGDTNWVYRYDGPEDSYDGANSVVYGADNNIYTAGYEGRIEQTCILVISLKTSGTPGDTNWIYRYYHPWHSYDVANSITYGLDDNIYAAGYIWDNGTLSDFTVMSLPTVGDTNWIYRYNGPGNADDVANSLVYGADGNIYAAGWSYGNGPHRDFTVISLTTAGNANWIYRYNGPDNAGAEANSIVYGADGNVYAAGWSYSIGTASDFTVISLTTAGDTNWVYRYNGPGNADDVAISMVYGADGNLYAAGYSYGIGTFPDFTVISLTTAGDTNWVYRYNGPGNADDVANSIVYGADGNIYAAGYSYVNGTAFDFTVISLTTAGDTNWIYRYNGPGNADDVANSVVYGADGNVYAAGWSTGIGSGLDFTVISLPPELGCEEKLSFAGNCGDRATIFNGPLVLPAGKNCKVFDITGRAIMPSSLTPGIYFIEIDDNITQKVVKVR